VFLVSSIGLVPQAVLERAMRFARLAKIETGAALASVATALAMAVAGLGVWSRASQMLTRALVASTATGWCPRWVFDRREVGTVRAYSLNLTGLVVASYVARNLDNVIIGCFLGSRDLGYYGVAYRIMGRADPVLYHCVVRVWAAR